MENTKAVMKPASITIEKNRVKNVRKLNVKVLVRAITIPVIILMKSSRNAKKNKKTLSIYYKFNYNIMDM